MKVKNFEDTLSKPITVGSKFYVYYDLYKLKGIDKFKDRYQKIRDVLYRDIYNYGIWVVGNELDYLPEFGITPPDYHGNRGRDLSYYFSSGGPMYKEDDEEWFKEWFTRKTDKCISIFKDLYKRVYDEDPSVCIMKVLKEMIRVLFEYNTHSLYEHETTEEKSNYLVLLDRLMNIFSDEFGFIKGGGNSDVSCFLEGARDLFNIDFYAGTLREDYGIEYDSALPNLNKAFGWASGGGSNWGDISQLLLSREDYTKTMFVDQAFDTQHNLGIFLNKIPPSDEEDKLVYKISDIDEDVARFTGAFERKDPLPWDTLTKLLDKRQQGDLGIMYEVVSQEDPDVDDYLHKNYTEIVNV